MKNFFLALQFLTIIPVKIKHIDESRISRSVIYFPLVGLLLGLILTGANNFLYFLNLEHLFINVILIVFLIFLTGGMHLDGLADTIDAFSSRKNKEEMLRIMRDSSIGVMGVLSLISIVLLKIALLSSISVSLKMSALLLMCILSRWSLVLSMFLFPYAREKGKAKMLIQGTDLRAFGLSTIITLVCVIIVWRAEGLLIMAIVAIVAYVFGKFTSSKIGGITGDTLGATNELIETITLFTICALPK